MRSESVGRRNGGVARTAISSPAAASPPSRPPTATRFTAGPAGPRAAGRCGSSAGRRRTRAPRPADEDHRAGRAVVGAQRLALGREQQQDQPGRRDGHPRRVHRPGLPGHEFRAGAGVVAQERRQRGQQPAEIRAADLAGDPQRLDDPVADGIGERVLQPVQAVVEPPGRPVVGPELPERFSQRLRPARADARQRLRQREARRGRRRSGCPRPRATARAGPPGACGAVARPAAAAPRRRTSRNTSETLMDWVTTKVMAPATSRQRDLRARAAAPG